MKDSKNNSKNLKLTILCLAASISHELFSIDVKQLKERNNIDIFFSRLLYSIIINMLYLLRYYTLVKLLLQVTSLLVEDKSQNEIRKYKLYYSFIHKHQSGDLRIL